MKLRLLQTLGQLGPFSSGSRASTIPVAKSTGALRMRHLELPEYSILKIEADVDVIWRPGPPKARLRLRESLLRHLKIEPFEQTLSIEAACDFDGDRPLIDLSCGHIAEVHLGASSQANLYDLRSNMLIVSAFDRSGLRAQGHTRALHLEAGQRATLDCASLICEIAVADLRDECVVLIRAEAALQAETRGDSQLLTIGYPLILDVRRLV